MVGGWSGGGGTVRLFAVGTMSRSRLVRSTLIVPNWFAIERPVCFVNGDELSSSYPTRCCTGSMIPPPFLSAGAHSLRGKRRVSDCVPNWSCAVTVLGGGGSPPGLIP